MSGAIIKWQPVDCHVSLSDCKNMNILDYLIFYACLIILID